MITKKTLIKFGFIKDEENLRFKEVFKDGVKLKEVHIDIYSESPLVTSTSFMLLLRTIEKNIMVSNNETRIILNRNDTYKTQFMNVLLSKMTDCFYKITECGSEFIINIQNIHYRIAVLN